MSVIVSLGRPGRSAVLLGCLLIAGTSAGYAQGEVSPVPSPDPAASASAESTASTSSPLAYPPLPGQVAVIPADIPTVSVPAGSEAGTLVVGTAIEYSLGHCGLWSPVDLDGSLWQPLGGSEADGSPITSDAAIGELINATPGQFVLLAPDTAEFTSSSGTLVAFSRAPGELDYPLCM